MTVIEERSDARIAIDVDDQGSGAFPQALLYPRRTVLISASIKISGTNRLSRIREGRSVAARREVESLCCPPGVRLSDHVPTGRAT
jgi:hypothetical protein